MKAADLQDMRILVLSAYFPWHGHGGGVLVSNLLRELSKRNAVTLLTFAEAQDRTHFDEVTSLGAAVEVVDLPPADSTDTAAGEDGLIGSRRGLVLARKVWQRCPLALRRTVWELRQCLRIARQHSQKHYPDEVIARQSEAFREALARQLERGHFDVVVAEWAEMVPYGTHIPDGVLRVLDSHELRSLTYRRRACYESALSAKLYWLSQALKMRRLEQAATRNFDLVTAVSQHERTKLESMRRGVAKLIWNPIGIDVAALRAPENAQRRPNTLLFIGNMARVPNQDAVLYFLTDIFPAIKVSVPAAKLIVVGGGVPEWLRKFAEPGSVEFVGYTPDLKPYLHTCSVYVLPVRQGAGIKIKAMEAMAAGIPIVSTPEGSEGLDFVSDRAVLVAKNHRHFAELVIQSLNEPELQLRTARAALNIVERYYDYRANVQVLETEYRRMVADRTAGNASSAKGRGQK